VYRRRRVVLRNFGPRRSSLALLRDGLLDDRIWMSSSGVRRKPRGPRLPPSSVRWLRSAEGRVLAPRRPPLFGFLEVGRVRLIEASNGGRIAVNPRRSTTSSTTRQKRDGNLRPSRGSRRSKSRRRPSSASETRPTTVRYRIRRGLVSPERRRWWPPPRPCRTRRSPRSPIGSWPAFWRAWKRELRGKPLPLVGFGSCYSSEGGPSEPSSSSRSRTMTWATRGPSTSSTRRT
jgi:hypothetical protein